MNFDAKIYQVKYCQGIVVCSTKTQGVAHAF